MFSSSGWHSVLHTLSMRSMLPAKNFKNRCSEVESGNIIFQN